MMNPLQHGERETIDGQNPATDEIHCDAPEHAPSLLRHILSAESRRFEAYKSHKKYRAVVMLRSSIALFAIYHYHCCVVQVSELDCDRSCSSGCGNYHTKCCSGGGWRVSVPSASAGTGADVAAANS